MLSFVIYEIIVDMYIVVNVLMIILIPVYVCELMNLWEDVYKGLPKNRLTFRA